VTTLSPAPRLAPIDLTSARPLAVLLVATALLAFAPVIVMGPAFGWPASLSRPAAEQLVAIHAHADAVTLGYGLYLLYSVLLAPALIGLAAAVAGRLDRPLAATVVAFAALGTLARSIGILRWLTVMPVLADRHASADASDRATAELVFDAITRYGGGIGEVLGVSLFTALALGVLAVGGFRNAAAPRLLVAGTFGMALVIGALAMPVFGGPEVVPVAIAVTMLSTWLVACAVWVWRRRAAVVE
jgi:hypothetical protein